MNVRTIILLIGLYIFLRIGICHATCLNDLDKASFRMKLKEYAYKVSNNLLHNKTEKFSDIDVKNLQDKLCKIIIQNNEYYSEYIRFINEYSSISGCFVYINKIISEKLKFEKIDKNVEYNKDKIIVSKNKGKYIPTIEERIFFQTATNIDSCPTFLKEDSCSNRLDEESNEYIHNEYQAAMDELLCLKSNYSDQNIPEHSQKLMIHIENILNYQDLCENSVELVMGYWAMAKVCYDNSITVTAMFENFEKYRESYGMVKKILLAKITNSNNMFFAMLKFYGLIWDIYYETQKELFQKIVFEYLTFVKTLPTYEALKPSLKIHILVMMAQIALDRPEYCKIALSQLNDVISLLSSNQEQFPPRKVIHLKAKIIFDYISSLYEKNGDYKNAIEQLKIVVKLAQECPQNEGPCVGYNEACKGSLCKLGQEARDRIRALETTNSDKIELEFERKSDVEPIYVNEINDKINEMNIYKGIIKLKNLPDNISALNVELSFTHDYDKKDDILLENSNIRNRRFLDINLDSSHHDIPLEPGFIENKEIKNKIIKTYTKDHLTNDFEFKCNYFGGDIFILTAIIDLNGKKIQCNKKLQVWKRYKIEPYCFDALKSNFENSLLPELNSLNDKFKDAFVIFEIDKQKQLQMSYEKIIISGKVNDVKKEISVDDIITKLRNDNKISFCRGNKINILGVNLIAEDGLPNVQGCSYNNMQEYGSIYPKLDVFSNFIALDYLREKKYSKLKCILHELGHSFGLIHHTFSENISWCCMVEGNDSTWVGQEYFCQTCQNIIKNSYLFIYPGQLKK